MKTKILGERTTAQTSTSTANNEHTTTKGENDREGAADAGRQQRVTRDAEAAVALLEAKSERRERKKDADRAEQLYQRASEQGNATSMLLMDKL